MKAAQAGTVVEAFPLPGSDTGCDGLEIASRAAAGAVQRSVPDEQRDPIPSRRSIPCIDELQQERGQPAIQEDRPARIDHEGIPSEIAGQPEPEGTGAFDQ